MNSLRTAYEHVFYPSFPRSATTPDRLAAVATFFGLERPDPETARVLEIGCSDGGNLLSLAITTPRGSFLGIDLAESAVALGMQRIRELGLTHIELRPLDLSDFPGDAGSFDYVIVHGVFSWVPPSVRTAILQLIQRHLSANGVAYIDHNAQPGGHVRYAFRESMRYHVRRFQDPQQRIDQARALLKLIIDANPPDSLHRSLAEAELERLLRTTDAALFHDSLSDENEPLYFHEFIAGAAGHDLQYLAEADVAEMSDARLPATVRERLAGIRNLVEKEQYLDILTNRTFRQTLLCRADRKINRVLDGSTLSALFFSSRADVSQGESEGQLVFRTALGVAATTTHPLAQASMRVLRNAGGQRLTLAAIAAGMHQNQTDLANDLERELPSILLHLVMSGVVEIHARPAPFTRALVERPIASPLARLQVRRGERVSTLDHRSIDITEEPTRRLLLLLDGSRTLLELANLLTTGEAQVSEMLRGLADDDLLCASS